jgi:ATP-binding cassette subfamily B protein
MENIRYGAGSHRREDDRGGDLANADHSSAACRRATRRAIGARQQLSQGQRQLLAIARAILAEPGILILEEATSSVDTRTEQHIQERCLRLSRSAPACHRPPPQHHRGADAILDIMRRNRRRARTPIA